MNADDETVDRAAPAAPGVLADGATPAPRASLDSGAEGDDPKLIPRRRGIVESVELIALPIPVVVRGRIAWPDVVVYDFEANDVPVSSALPPPFGVPYFCRAKSPQVQEAFAALSRLGRLQDPAHVGRVRLELVDNRPAPESA